MSAAPWRNFPSFSEGLSLRVPDVVAVSPAGQFPFLFGGTFIEGSSTQATWPYSPIFPFLFGGTFIEGNGESRTTTGLEFPFLFGGTFIEGLLLVPAAVLMAFPFLFGGTFIEGERATGSVGSSVEISLPFRRDFH